MHIFNIYIYIDEFIKFLLFFSPRKKEKINKCVMYIYTNFWNQHLNAIENKIRISTFM